MVIEVASNDPLDKIQAAKDRDIRFVELQFTDLLGIVKGITIPLYRLEESLEHGTWFDGSSIEGFTRIAESDQWLQPDMNTFAEIPWQGGDMSAGPMGSRGTARVICDVMTPDGQPFVGDPRGVLKKQLKRAEDMGYIWNAGPELEFFLFRRDAEGGIAPLPHDQGGYFDFSTDLAQSVRRDMVNALEAFGIRVEADLLTVDEERDGGRHALALEWLGGEDLEGDGATPPELPRGRLEAEGHHAHLDLVRVGTGRTLGPAGRASPAPG